MYFHFISEMRTLKDSVGRLKVTVVEAADLQATDPNGRSDPFCVVKLGDVQEQITDVRPTTLNPKWNHKVGIRIPILVSLWETTHSHTGFSVGNYLVSFGKLEPTNLIW